MAKKKSRSANVARKREKRNRDRKFKNKQLAVEKQRKVPYRMMDEERLHACLMKSRELLDEPEFEKVHFDIDLMYTELVELLKDRQDTSILEVQVQLQPESLEESDDRQYLNSNDEQSTSPNSDEICERFRTEVLLSLITPKFLRILFSALTACENRLRRTGDRDLAEVVFVAQSLFEIVPPDIFVEHPLIQDIGIRTLHLLTEQPPPFYEEHPVVRSILSDVLDTTDNTEYQEEKLSSMLSDAIVEKPSLVEVEAPQVANIPPANLTKPPPIISQPIPSPDSLPAKAIYKNFDGLAIREVLKEWQGDTLEKETKTQLEYFNHDQELYITVTENRVQLHTHSEEKLTEAMEELETHCQSALMYLAKTYDEGGKTDATE
jgi:hypothetical protein